VQCIGHCMRSRLTGAKPQDVCLATHSSSTSSRVVLVMSIQSRPVPDAGKAPGEFPQDGLRLDYGRDLVSDPALDVVVAGLLEPMVNDRMRAREALGVLEGKLAAGRCSVSRPREPMYVPASSRLRMSCGAVVCGCSLTRQW
jgi:hypothetical protein